MRIVTEDYGGESYSYVPLGNHVVRAIGVCGGRPTFKYTRIEVAGVLECIAAGERIDDLVTGYQGRVPREAILEAIEIANREFVNSLPELPAVVAG